MREIHPLPVNVTPHSSESGLGFLLRLARKNGMSLSSLFGLARVRSALDISSEGIRALAYLGEVSPAWLASRLVMRGRHDGRSRRVWMGHAWQCAWTLRLGRPQVCSACLRADGFCTDAWEVTGVFLCVRHAQVLTDRCSHCQQGLSWLRPDVDVCSCGHYLSGPPRDEALCSRLIDWVQLVLARLQGETPLLPSGHDWPHWVTNLSPEGATAMVHALGVISKPHERVGADASRSIPDSAWMAAVVERGLIRLSSLTIARQADALNGIVYEQALERLVRHGCTPADRDIAAHLVHWLSGSANSGLSVTGRKAKRQFDLFGAEP
jgi:hypothetical protein